MIERPLDNTIERSLDNMIERPLDNMIERPLDLRNPPAYAPDGIWI